MIKIYLIHLKKNLFNKLNNNRSRHRCPLQQRGCGGHDSPALAPHSAPHRHELCCGEGRGVGAPLLPSCNGQ